VILSILKILLYILIGVAGMFLILYALYRYARFAKRVPYTTHSPKRINTETATYSVLSLNVKMIDWYTAWPSRWLSKFIPHKRRDKIIEFLERGQHDVVLLQEAFSVAFQDIVIKRLRHMYPHTLVYRPKTPLFRWINNGLMILSKYPLNNPSLTEYSKLTDADSWVPKGAVMATVDSPQPFKVLNTHTQAFEGWLNDKIRINGVTEMRKAIESYGDPQLPFVLGGDFNISRRHGYFRAILRVLKVPLYKLEGALQYSWDPEGNPLCSYEHGAEQETLDWIFIRDITKKITHKAARVIPISISDHYPVERTFSIAE